MYQSEDQVLLRTARHYAVNFPKLYYKTLREKNALIAEGEETIKTLKAELDEQKQKYAKLQQSSAEKLKQLSDQNQKQIQDMSTAHARQIDLAAEQLQEVKAQAQKDAAELQELRDRFQATDIELQNMN